jgi:uncharacterized membrane protein
MKPKTNPEQSILTGLLTALITATTIVIAIPIPFTNGYVHPGDSMIFMAVLILGRRRGAFAAGLGSAFADIILGYFIWAPFTFVIKGLMAFLAGLIIEKCAEKPRNLVISCTSAVALWLLFDAAVIKIANDAARHNLINSTAAAGAGGDPASELGSVTDSVAGMIEANAMWGSLLLPVLLILITVVLRKKENISIPPGHIIGMTGGGLFMVFGYYIAGSLIYGNFTVAVFGIPANIAQFAGGFLIASLLSAALQNTSAKRYFVYGSKKTAHGKTL